MKKITNVTWQEITSFVTARGNWSGIHILMEDEVYNAFLKCRLHKDDSQPQPKKEEKE